MFNPTRDVLESQSTGARGPRHLISEGAPVEWIVFDYGEVISLPPPARAVAALAEAIGVTPERFWPVYWRHRGDYDRGVSDAAGFWGEVCAGLDRAIDDELLDMLVARDFAAWSSLNRETLRLLEELAAAGTRLALLSNAPADLARRFEEQPWAGLFRHRFFSADLRRTKPDPRIFHEVCGRLDARPYDLVFIDDRPENVDAAGALGIESLLFTDVPRLRTDLAHVRGTGRGR
jgi:putative hydrolase of the HAD superfamily